MADIYEHIKDLTRIEVEFEDENGSPLYLKSYIKAVEPQRFLVDPPVLNAVSYKLPVGQRINIVIRKEGGVFSGVCEVTGLELSELSGFWLTYPYNSQYVQQREFVRVPLPAKVKMIISEDPQKTKIREFEITAKDISGGGFSYISAEPLNNYYDIETEIHLGDGFNEPIITKCEHVYSKPVDILGGGKSKYMNALAFLDLPKNSVDRIVKACFKFQLEMRRKGIV